MTEPFVARIDRDVVAVRGPDATSFLQSLVSQDLAAIPVGASARALLLQPQGKLIVDFYAHHETDDEWWCVCEGGFGSTLADGLNRFKIRVKVDIEQPASAALAIRGADPPPGVRAIPVAWSGSAAFDIVGAPAEIDTVREQIDLPEVDAASYERARIEAGVPRLGADLDERTIPQEAYLDRDAVSFTKGCFVGQELVCRLDTRGHVNRSLRRLRSTGGTLRVGTEVTAGDKVVGAVTSSVGDVGLAMVRREVDNGDEVSVGDTIAVVEPVVSG